MEFSLDSLKGKVQIVAYLAKSVGINFKDRTILDLEAFSILESLHSLRKYISNTKCILLTDSRVLYYLFHQRVGDSSVKIRRWVLKLISDYPLVELHFVKTTANLADYLTRQGLPRGDMGRIGLKELSLPNIHDKLPKYTFTLAEWDKFVQENPQYITVAEINPVTLSLFHGLSNIEDLTNPIGILQNRLERSKIIENQKIEFEEIYQNCIKNKRFSYLDKEKGLLYKLFTDFLLVKANKKNQQFKILLPPSMEGLLFSYLHLIGHMGVIKMLENLKGYYIPQKYSKIKRFVAMCHPCFLMHRSNRKNTLGSYPIPTHPFEEISMDLAENLNKIKNQENLLIIQDVLTDFILIFPMKTKTSAELINIFTYSVLQSFNIKRVHSDNGSCFRNKNWLQLMAALKIKVIDSSANNPSSRGKAERAVQQVKTIMRKMLVNAKSGTLNWEFLPFLVSKVMNHSITPRTGFKPIEMIMGSGSLTESFLDLPPLIPPHHLVKDKKEVITVKTEEINKMAAIAKENLELLRKSTHEKLNESRINKAQAFKKGEIVFAIDRYVIPGNSRPLKSKFFPSPYVIIDTKYTTCLIERISDKFRTLISNDDIKLYKHVEEFTGNVPEEITKIFQAQFEDLMPEDINKITRFDPLPVPPGIAINKQEMYTELPLEEENSYLSSLEEEEGDEDLRLTHENSLEKAIKESHDTTPFVPVSHMPEQEHKNLEVIPEEQEVSEENTEEVDNVENERVLRSGKRVSFIN
jgi:hypothetical protein